MGGLQNVTKMGFLYNQKLRMLSYPCSFSTNPAIYIGREPRYMSTYRSRRAAHALLTAFLILSTAFTPAATVTAAAATVPVYTQAPAATVTAPAAATAAAAAAKNSAASTTSQAPGKVILSSVSAHGYHGVTIRWKTVPDATSYIIYYRLADAKKWTKILSVKAKPAARLKYTHISTKEHPILVGRSYAFTVRAYNSKNRALGDFDRKGLAIRTYPEEVRLGSAVLNDEKTAVTLSWNKARGGNRYYIYRRTGTDTKWTRIAAVASSKHSYVDKTPVQGVQNIYTVRCYNTKGKVFGKYDTAGAVARTKDEAADYRVQQLLVKTKTAGKTGQIILVVDHNLSLWEKGSGGWVKTLTAYCGYGCNGMSADRHEGDRTTPIGSFPILHGFGSAKNPGSTMQYKKITNNSYWSGEYSTYNQWVESKRRVAGEHLIDYYQYKYAMAIGFNRNPTVYKKGAAIFLHCKSRGHWSTAGCVSVEESVMKSLLLKSHNGVYMIIVPREKDIASY